MVQGVPRVFQYRYPCSCTLTLATVPVSSLSTRIQALMTGRLALMTVRLALLVPRPTLLAPRLS